jgi:hypothetical protein
VSVAAGTGGAGWPAEPGATCAGAGAGPPSANGSIATKLPGGAVGGGGGGDATTRGLAFTAGGGARGTAAGTGAIDVPASPTAAPRDGSATPGVAVGTGGAAVTGTAPGGAEGNTGAARDVTAAGGWRRADSSGAAADTATGRGLISSCNSQSVIPQIEANTIAVTNPTACIADIVELKGFEVRQDRISSPPGGVAFPRRLRR